MHVDTQSLHRGASTCRRGLFPSRAALVLVLAAVLGFLIEGDGAAHAAEEWYQRGTGRLLVNRAEDGKVFATFERREEGRPVARLATGVEAAVGKGPADPTEEAPLSVRLDFKPEEAVVTAAGALANGEQAKVLNGAYRFIPPADRLVQEKARAGRADAELNRVYGEIRGRLNAARAAELRDLQREWLRDVYAPSSESGAGGGETAEQWQIRADRALERIQFLKDFAAGDAAGKTPGLRDQLKAAQEAESWPAAAEIARRILEGSPKDSAMWEARASAFAQAQDWPRVLSTLEAWSKAAPNTPAADALRGDALLATHDEEGAIRAWSACIAAAPKDVETRDKLADLLRKRGDWAGAAKTLEQRVQIEPAPAALAKLAVCHAVLRDWKRAAAEVRRASQADAADSTVEATLPRIERLEKALPQIQKLDRAAAAAPKDPSPVLDRALLFLDLDWPEIAIVDTSEAFRQQPRWRRAVVQQAAALGALNRTDEAKALGVNMASDELRNAGALRELGAADAEIQRNGPSAPALARRARDLNRLKQYALALEDADAALKLDPNADAALAARGQALVLSGKDWEALPVLTRATELNPRNAAAWQWRGEAEMRHHRLDAAVDAFSRALDMEPNNQQALASRESSFRQLGRVPEADADAARLQTFQKK